MDSFQFDEFSDGEKEEDKGGSLTRSTRSRSKNQAKKRTGKNTRGSSKSRRAQPSPSKRKKRKSGQENQVNSSQVSRKGGVRKTTKATPQSRRSRTMLRTPSPLKALNISPIKGRRALRSSVALPRMASSVSIFTPAQEQAPGKLAGGLVSEPIHPIHLKNTAALAASPRATRISTRATRSSTATRRRPGRLSPLPTSTRVAARAQGKRGRAARRGGARVEELSGDESEDRLPVGSPAVSSSSETSEDYLELFNPGLRERINKQKKKAHKKTQEELDAELAQGKLVQARAKAQLDAAKDFYSQIDAQSLEDCFIIE